MTATLLTLLLATALPGQRAAAPAEQAVLRNCYVTQIEEVQVPAQEPGVLVKVEVREGDAVQAGQLLAQIDDIQARMQQRVAQFELQVAREEADSDINIRYAKATEAVARQEWFQAVEANKKVAGAVPEAEVRRLVLKQNEAALSIEQAEMRRRIASLEARVSEARVEAAAVNIERRRITAPLDALVLKVQQHEGEWVQPGVPVFHLIKLDRLWVEGSLKAQQYTPAEVHGRPVTVKVTLARGREETFPGQVVFAKPIIDADDTFLLRAEIANRQENGFWLLSPGMPAEMTIQIR
ncbi:MAG: efflux RND transporter periplasmic adaptor subunit [Thermoguttaceae bacterium]|jgi:multidrug resistance efflux pump|nr:efflux RND transporter periplasmic adaptor subunit [Thermoguttaceae bacterium]